MDQIIKQGKADIRATTWNGVKNVNGTTNLDICNGVLKLITDGVAAGKITEVTTGTITASNVVEMVEKVAKSIGDGYAETPAFMPVNRTIFDWYVSAPETQFGRTMSVNEMVGAGYQQSVYIRGTNVKLVKEPSLGSSQRMAVYPENFLYAGTNTLGDLNNMDFQKYEWTVKILMDFKWGVQFTMLDSTTMPVVVNDQA